MKYSMFIGRWQPLHAGHLWLINERLKEGKNVCLAIRDVEPNENQPWTAQEIENMVHEGELKELIKDGRVITPRSLSPSPAAGVEDGHVQVCSTRAARID